MTGKWNLSAWIKLSLFPGTYLQSVLSQTGQGLSTPCVYTLVTHHSCYGCGMMRSLNALWQGAWCTSWEMNKLGSFVWLLLATLFVQQVIKLISGPTA